MPKKEKKKSWKDTQRERQIKQQRAQEAYKVQSEIEAKRKPRQLPKGKIIIAVFLIVIIFGAYGIWQFATPTTPSNGELPPPNIPPGQLIYIRPDGEVNPANAPLLNEGNNRYTFTADMYNTIVVLRDNIVIDGANHVLQGADEYYSRGIDLTGRSNVTITNLKIKNFDYGVYLSGSSRNVLSNNDLTNNYCAIWMVASSNDNVISGNTLSSNEMYAVWLKDSSNNNISENRITLHGNYTIYIRASNFTTFTANHIENNNLGIFFYDQASNNSIYGNNFVNNRDHVTVHDLTNVWNNASTGNYWSDYEEKYPEAEPLAGIWNTPYVIDDNNRDNYPLVNPLILD